MAGNGVTCGRPSDRTVEIQNNSAPSMVCSTRSQGVADAFGSLKRASSSAAGIAVVIAPSCVTSMERPVPFGIMWEFANLSHVHLLLYPIRCTERTKRGHVVIYPPDKRFPPVVFSGTPGDQRSIKN